MSRKEGGLQTHGVYKKSLEDKPLITVITVVFNGEKHLEVTIQSVLNQTHDNVEYIIIDGSSTDGTLDIIKKYEDQIDYWISEPDKGIYDAMNKGLFLSKGVLVAFLNADDWYEVDALMHVASAFRYDQSLELIYGDVKLIGNSNSILLKGDAVDFGKNLHHQGCFFKTSMHQQYPYNLAYPLAADKDCIISMLRNKAKTHYINGLIANYRRDGASSGIFKYHFDLYHSRKKHFGITRALYMFIRSILIRIFFLIFNNFEKRVIENKKVNG